MKANVLIGMVVLLFGCQYPTTHTVTFAPKIHDVPKEKVVLLQQDKKITWEKLLSVFANSEFSIERINLEAYQVNMHLTGKSELYIDCGTRTFNTDGSVTHIKNSQSKYRFSAYRHRHLDTYAVSNHFSGYADILVIGNEASSKIFLQLDLELMTDEKLTSTQGMRYNTERKYQLKLSPNKPAYSEVFKANCRSTGHFERQVMQLISLVKKSDPSPFIGDDVNAW